MVCYFKMFVAVLVLLSRYFHTKREGNKVAYFLDLYALNIFDFVV